LEVCDSIIEDEVEKTCKYKSLAEEREDNGHTYPRRKISASLSLFQKGIPEN